MSATQPLTRITELLTARGIPFRLLPHQDPVFTVAAAAVQRGVAKAGIVKSILLRESKRHRFVLACVTGEQQVDPRRVRAHLPGQWKRLSFATAEEIERVTGSVTGAVAPLGLPEAVPVVFDEAITDREMVSISSGNPLFGLELRSQDLVRASGAELAMIARDESGQIRT